MSITAEEIARREFAFLEAPDRVPVKITATNVCGFLLPRSVADDDRELTEVTAVFKIWTYSDNQIIDRACRYSAKRGDGKDVEQTDVNEMRRLMVKRNLLEWSLDIPIERENGWMTPDSYKRVGSIPAPLLEALVLEFEQSFMITTSEEKTITKQCAILFNKNGRGVSNACDAVSMFCTYGNFNEKFGLTREELTDLPYKEYQMLRMVMGREGEAAKRASKTGKDHHAATRVAMGSTKVRASRGKRIAL
jgi:hypothetical protein